MPVLHRLCGHPAGRAFIALRPALGRKAREGGRWAATARLLALGSEPPDDRWLERARPRLRWLGLVGIPIAIGVHGGTGAIFAVVKSRPSWYTGLFPIVFLVSALASGGALLTFLTAVSSRLPAPRKLDLVQRLARLTVGILAVDLLLLGSEVLVVFYGGVPAHMAGLRDTLFGPFWWVFWFVQLLLGAVVPMMIVAARRTGRSLGWLGFAGLLVAIGIIGVRLNIVIPAQIQPEFPTLPEAYHHERFARGYFPSPNEWLAGPGTLALGLVAFLVARGVLPLDDVERAGLSESKIAAGGQS